MDRLRQQKPGRTISHFQPAHDVRGPKLVYPNHSEIIDTLRELYGGVFQMPASITVMHDEKLRKDFKNIFRPLN